MPAVTSYLYGPLGDGSTVYYHFRKGKLHGTYQIIVDGFGFIGYVVKCIDGWSDSFVSNPLRKTRREAAEDLIDQWLVRNKADDDAV